MARTAKKASPKRAQKSKRAESPPTKRVSGKAKAVGSQRAPARKQAKRATKKPAATKASKAARPKRMPAQRKKEILAQVARPRKNATHEDALPVEEHQHEDPRLLEIKSGNPGAPGGPNTNFGEYKNKAVARMDPPGNWFRKAPKQPEK